jgi:hypothetical protein
MGISLSILVSLSIFCWIILLTCNIFYQPLHAIFSPPSSFLSYPINPYSFDGKRQNLQCQQPWQQQCHESTTSQLVVGHADLAFRDYGANATCYSEDATYGRKKPVKKRKHDASKTLGEWTKKQCDAPRFLQFGYRKHMQQPLSEMSYTHRDFFDFVAPPSLGRTQASTDKKCYNYIERGHLTHQCPLELKHLGKHYLSRVKQDYARRRIDHITPKIPKRRDVVFYRWKLATLEEVYPEDNMS